jgi:hypothetical protein
MHWKVPLLDNSRYSHLTLDFARCTYFRLPARVPSHASVPLCTELPVFERMGNMKRRAC